MLREGLRLLIEAERDLLASPAAEADVTILDLADEDALTTLQQGSSLAKGRFIVLTDGCELDELDTILQAGARGLVVKSAHPASLLQAIRRVSQGQRWLDPEIQEKLASPDSILPSPRERWESLSKRERQIAELVLQGRRSLAAHQRSHRPQPPAQRLRQTAHHQPGRTGALRQRNRLDLAVAAGAAC